MFEWKTGLSSEERIRQNVANIVQTKHNEVRFDIDFGITPDFIDKTIGESVSLAVTEMIDAIAKYEPRASLTPNDIIMIVSGKGIISLEVSEK